MKPQKFTGLSLALDPLPLTQGGLKSAHGMDSYYSRWTGQQGKGFYMVSFLKTLPQKQICLHPKMLLWEFQNVSCLMNTAIKIGMFLICHRRNCVSGCQVNFLVLIAIGIYCFVLSAVKLFLLSNYCVGK